MAWPTSKATTTHTDSPSDSISSARADINQNILNVNSIIDEFAISSPSDGDLLQYSSTSGQWEQVAAADLTTKMTVAIIRIAVGEELISGNNYRRAIDISFDPYGVYTASGSYQLVLDAGNYLFVPQHRVEPENESSVTIYNETASSSLASISHVEIGTTGDGLLQNAVGFTLATQSNISFRQETASSTNRDNQVQFLALKI